MRRFNMQQPPQMLSTAPSLFPTNVTTEQIQKYLDDNKKLILAILENQNLGKLSECAEYQAVLQKNLMYLAAIADAQPQGQAQTQPQALSVTSQSETQQQGQYKQNQQNPQAAIAQQYRAFPPNLAYHFSPFQQQDPHGNMAIRPGPNNGMHHVVQTGFGLQGGRQIGSGPGSC